jgi:hypothetical protein
VIGGDRFLLELSFGGSSLQLVGPERKMGVQPTTIRLDAVPREANLRVLGLPATVISGVVNLAEPLLFEHSEYGVYLKGPLPRLLLTSPSPDIGRLKYETDTLSHYELNFGSSVGDVIWSWRMPAGIASIQLEVFPTKLDYRNDFASIKADIGRLSRMLLADMGGATGLPMSPFDEPQQAGVEWLEQVRRESASLRASMQDLLRRLRQQVRNGELLVTPDRMRGRRPIRLRDSGLIHFATPDEAVAVRNATLTDATRLNGHLRWEVERFLSVAGHVTTADWFITAPSPFREALDATIRAAYQWRTALAHIPPVPELPSLQTRLRDPLYARAFASLRRLRLGLQEGESPELLGLKNIWLIYEYWVFLKVVEHLKSHFSTIVAASSSLFREIGGQLYLVKGNESRIVLQGASGRQIGCFYNRAFNGLPTTNQKPDITIEALDSGDILIVDAKYRLGRTPEYLLRYGQPGPEEDDINSLHRYRDAIVELPGPRRRVAAGLIAFPGPDAEAFKQQHFFQSWKEVRIGAIPMLPGRTSTLEEALNDFFPADRRPS